MSDQSNGYEAYASWWANRRKPGISPRIVLEWAKALPAGAAVLDVGCGDGYPMSVALAEIDFDIHGVDASPGMIAAFRKQLPNAKAACEAAEHSTYFNRTFDGIISWGLLFLLTPDTQRTLLGKLANALHPGGRLLFTAPRQICEWNDALTGLPSISLGREEYTRILNVHGVTITGDAVDEGENYYYLGQKA